MLSPEYWSAISTPPTTTTTVPNNAAGPTPVQARGRLCCGTSTTSEPSTPKTPHWPDGAAAVHQLYVAAKAFNHHEPWQRRVAQLAWERKLLAICRPFLADPSAVRDKLCRRIERFIKEPAPYWIRELFVFVAEPDVPATTTRPSAACAIWSSAARSAGAPGRNVVPSLDTSRIDGC